MHVVRGVRAEGLEDVGRPASNSLNILISFLDYNLIITSNIITCLYLNFLL